MLFFLLFLKDQTIDAAKSPQNPKGSRNKEAVSKKLMRDGEVTTMNDTNPEAPMEVDETANKVYFSLCYEMLE